MARGHLPAHQASKQPRQPELAGDHPLSAMERERCSGKNKKLPAIKENKALCRQLAAFHRSFPPGKLYACALEKKQDPSLKYCFEIMVKLQILRCRNCTRSLPPPFLSTLGEILAEQTGMRLWVLFHALGSSQSPTVSVGTLPLASSWAHGATSWATQGIAKQWPLQPHT